MWSREKAHHEMEILHEVLASQSIPVPNSPPHKQLSLLDSSLVALGQVHMSGNGQVQVRLGQMQHMCKMKTIGTSQKQK